MINFYFQGIYFSEKMWYTKRMKLKRFFKRLLIRWRKKKYDLRFPVCCKAHGVSFADRQGALAQSRSGDELQLVQVPLETIRRTFISIVSSSTVFSAISKKISRTGWRPSLEKVFASTGRFRKLRAARPIRISDAISESSKRWKWCCLIFWNKLNYK